MSESADQPEIDLEMTDRVAELAQVPPGDRDAGWFADFVAAVPTAAFAVAASETIIGPDGFPYLLFLIPPKEAEFQGYSMRVVLDLCLAKGIGIAIAPGENHPPQFAFNYGQLWSYKSTGRFDARAAAPPPTIPPPVGLDADRGKVMVGAPSERYFPAFARETVKRFLTMNGVGTPRAALVADSTGQRPQALLLNLYREDFKSDEHFRQIIARLMWYFPPDFVLRPLVERGSKVDELLEAF